MRNKSSRLLLLASMVGSRTIGALRTTPHRSRPSSKGFRSRQGLSPWPLNRRCARGSRGNIPYCPRHSRCSRGVPRKLCRRCRPRRESSKPKCICKLRRRRRRRYLRCRSITISTRIISAATSSSSISINASMGIISIRLTRRLLPPPAPTNTAPRAWEETTSLPAISTMPSSASAATGREEWRQVPLPRGCSARSKWTSTALRRPAPPSPTLKPPPPRRPSPPL
mmetsp:Transcript_22385/g.66362  ORF Transcript_22385/g.66362 Transcript_22385/m.66362 type:complete len:225 (-) Transcript_22385:665-1339(-)